MLRTGLRVLLEQEPGMEVIAEAKDGRSAVRMAAELSPDIVVMDIHMPDLNGIEATRQIRSLNGRGPRVVALSAHSDERYVQEMVRAGAAAYVLKEAAFEELATAVKLVAADKMYLSPSITHVVLDNYARDSRGGTGGTPSAYNTLTSREREILQLLAEGKATKQAAAHLNVSVKTVETHRRNIMDKLDIHSVAELTKYAIRQGLTGVES